MPRFSRAGDRHEVLDLADSVLREEPGDQHVGIREVELPGLRGQGGGQLEAPAAVSVQDRCENARRVERRSAVPVDGAVSSYQRDRVQVADQPMLGYRQVGGSLAVPDRNCGELEPAISAARDNSGTT